MSISAFQEKFIKGGCGQAILLVSGIGLIFGMVFSNCSRGQRLAAVDASGKEKKIFATFGDVSLPADALDKAVLQQQQSSQIPPEVMSNLPPEYRLQMIAQAMGQLIGQAEIYQLAVKRGFKQEDAAIKSELHMGSEKEFRKYLTDMLRSQGQLKPNSTDADLDKMVQDATKSQNPPNGKTFSQLYTAQSEDIDKALKDPDKQLEVKLQASQLYLKDQLQAGINPTDDDVKRGFEKRTLKRIIFKLDAKTKPEDAKVKADKAYQELKSGKNFDDVLDAESEDTPNPGKKKKSENTIDLDASTIDRMPDFKIAGTMQEGTYSEPVKVADGYAIYKFVSKKMDIPKDYDAKKDSYRQGYISQQVGKKFTEAKDALEKETKPTFTIKSYEAIYRLGKVMTTPPGADQNKEFQAIFDLAKSVTPTDDKPDLAATVEVAAIQRLYEAPGADKNKLKADRIAALQNYLTFFDNWAYRKEVIDSYKELKQGDKAFTELLTAMDKNNKYDAQGQSTFSDISAKFLEVKSANVGITADMEKQFRSKQDEWKKQKEEADKQAAALKKQQDEDNKKAAEEAKKSKQPSSGSGKGSTGGGLIPPGTPQKK